MKCRPTLACVLALAAASLATPAAGAQCSVDLPPDFNGAVAFGAGELPMVRVQGTSDESGTSAITEATRFNLGSVSKMMTAVAIGQLVEQGRMAFDDPIGRHVAGLPDEIAVLRIDQLLSHTGGLPLFLHRDLQEPINDAPDATSLVPFVVADADRETPGSFRYSNAGYVLLGAAIERVSGLTYIDYLARNILPVAGIRPQPVGWQAGDAEGVDPGQQAAARAMSRLKAWPAGSMILSAPDLWRFGRALAQGRLVRPETLARMMREGIELRPATADRPASRYGLGMGVSGAGETVAIGHTGGAQGIDVSLRIYPATGSVITVMANRSGSDSLNAPAVAKAIVAQTQGQACDGKR
jgi:D-alanyl-D-alanine carboxypeptidase